jgi:hypothetical protein
MRRAPALRRLLTGALLAGAAGGVAAAEFDLEAPDLDGRALMESVHDAHEQYPFIYEELSMVLVDRHGTRSARSLRRYSRVDADGTGRLLLLFDTPAEVEGTGMLATLGDEGVADVAMYLPALGGRELRGGGANEADFLGTDFTVENFVGERLADYRYVRRRSRTIDGVPHHVVDVFDRRDDPRTARALRRHFIRADVRFVTLTEHYDELGRLAKRQSTHDLARVDGSMWRGNMILMEDLEDRHSTLVKIDRRVFSRDYVPPEMFTEQWLLANHPPSSAAGEDDGDADAQTPAEPDDGAVPPVPGDGPAGGETVPADPLIPGDAPRAGLAAAETGS